MKVTWSKILKIKKKCAKDNEIGNGNGNDNGNDNDNDYGNVKDNDSDNNIMGEILARNFKVNLSFQM